MTISKLQKPLFCTLKNIIYCKVFLIVDSKYFRPQSYNSFIYWFQIQQKRPNKKGKFALFEYTSPNCLIELLAPFKQMHCTLLEALYCCNRLSSLQISFEITFYYKSSYISHCTVWCQYRLPICSTATNAEKFTNGSRSNYFSYYFCKFVQLSIHLRTLHG